MSEVKLFQGDCLEEMQKLIDKGVKVDLVLTDPPLWNNARWRSWGKTKNERIKKMG